MGVFLMILKIIGIILLSLIGIILCLLLMILLIPIRYQIHGNFKEQVKEKNISLELSYLMHMIVFIYQNENGTGNYRFKIFGHTLGDKNKRRKKAKKAKKVKSKNRKQPQKQIEMITQEKQETEAVKIEEFKKETYQDSNTDPAEQLNQKKKRKKKRKNTFSFRKIQDFFDKWRSTEDGNQILYRDVMNQIFRMLKSLMKHYQPRKVKGMISFSLEDPSMTGKLCGILSLMPVFLKPGVTINPDFERFENSVEGDLLVKGKIVLFYLACWTIRLLLDKNIRNLYTKIKEK